MNSAFCFGAYEPYSLPVFNDVLLPHIVCQNVGNDSINL